VPGVASAGHDASDRRTHVTLERDASSTTIRRAIEGVSQRADDDRLTVLAVGPVHTLIVHDGQVSADLLAPALHALGPAGFLENADVEIGPVWDVDVRTAKSGTAITIARKTIGALARADAGSSRLGRLRMHGRDNGLGGHDTVSVTGRDADAAISALRRMQPLQSLHQHIVIGAKPNVSMAVNGIDRVRAAYNQARRLIPRNAVLDVTSAPRWVEGLGSPAMRTRHGATEKGSIRADVPTLHAALPGLRRLQRAGCRVEWTAQDHSHLNDGPTIEVQSLTDATRGTPLDEADDGVAVMRALRQLHWHGTAALVFTARDGDARNRPSFLSTTAGASHATPDPGPSDEITALRNAWDTSRQVA